MRSISPGQREFQFRDDAESVTTEKVCTKCGLPKPHQDYYVKDKKTGRLYSWCKPCHLAMTGVNGKKAYLADPEMMREKARARRVADPEKAKEVDRKSRKKNIAKVRERERAYKAANPEKIREKKKRYKARRKHVIRAADARYREAHHEELRARHKAWREANPERLLEISYDARHRRRAKKAGAGGSHTTAEWEALKAFYDHTCLMCGRREPEIKLTRDHVIPISKGGDNFITNVQPLCRGCNARKHDRTIDLRDAQPTSSV